MKGGIFEGGSTVVVGAATPDGVVTSAAGAGVPAPPAARPPAASSAAGSHAATTEPATPITTSRSISRRVTRRMSAPNSTISNYANYQLSKSSSDEFYHSAGRRAIRLRIGCSYLQLQSAPGE